MMRVIILSLVICLLLPLSPSLAAVRKVPQEYPKIQAAINAANSNDTVLVSEGTYTENIRITKNIVVASHFIIDRERSHISNTIINGSSPANPDSGSTIIIEGDVDTTLTVMGFTITGGKGTKRYIPLEDITGYEGGGIDIFTTGGARISYNIIKNNTLNNTGAITETWGAGITVQFASTVSFYSIIEHNEIIHNSANGSYGEGAGMLLMTNGRVTDNIIVNNTAKNYGGGISILGGSAIVFERNYIGGNSAGNAGGAMFSYYYPFTAKQPTLTLINNIVTVNSAPAGAAFRFLGGDYRFINNTIVDHFPSTEAIRLSSPAGRTNVVRFFNTILWNPMATMEVTTGVGSLYASNNCVRGGMDGNDNLSTEPGFFPFDTLFLLSESSPCIGTGRASAVLGELPLSAPTVDYFGAPRPQQPLTRPDIGAVENELPTTARTEHALAAEPRDFCLEQNYPNPFNPATTIRYSIPSPSHVQLIVHDVLGRVVAILADEQQSSGWNEVKWNCGNAASGIYFYTLIVNNVRDTKTAVILK